MRAAHRGARPRARPGTARARACTLASSRSSRATSTQFCRQCRLHRVEIVRNTSTAALMRSEEASRDAPLRASCHAADRTQSGLNAHAAASPNRPSRPATNVRASPCATPRVIRIPGGAVPSTRCSQTLPRAPQFGPANVATGSGPLPGLCEPAARVRAPASLQPF